MRGLILLLWVSVAHAQTGQNGLQELDYSAWTECSHECGPDGQMNRTASCIDTKYGREIPDCKVISASCNIKLCEDDPDYVAWEEWSDCSVHCGGGTKTRSGVRNSGQTMTETIHCGMQSCVELDAHFECGIANIVFVLDSSHSVGELGWFKVKQFVIDIVSSLNIGEDATNVGVMSYATDVHENIALKQHYDVANLTESIWALPYLAGSTNTGEALSEANLMIRREKRPRIKNIMILISDGQSNINSDDIPLQAEKIDKVANIFAIGISDAVNTTEMESISDSLTQIDDFDSLQQLIDDLVEGACIRRHVFECDEWGEYEQCPVTCGGHAEQRRIKACKKYSRRGRLLDGDVTVVESKSCGYQPCPTTPPKPPPAVDCSTGDYMAFGTAAFLSDPNYCNVYFVCQRYTQDDGTYGYIHYEKLCPPNLYWKQEWLTCVFEYDVDTSKSCLVKEQQPTTTTTTTTSTPCPYAAIEEKPGYFFDGLTEIRCGENMTFSVYQCACIPEVIHTCNSAALLYFPFDADLNDYSCNRALSYQSGQSKVTIVDDGERGRVAHFDGSSSIDVGFLNNYFAGQEVTSWSVALSFKWTGSSSDHYGLVNNGNCNDAASFDLHLGEGDFSGAGFRTSSEASLTSIEKVETAQDSWQHIAAVYDGTKYVVYMNGQAVQSSPLSGGLGNTHCALTIGAQGVGYFHGFMDELYVYRKALSEDDVKMLADAH